MLSRRPTYEELMKETRTHRLKILPERQKRTQQGLLIEQVDFDDFDLSRYDKRELLMNNPEKGVQTDLFVDGSYYSSATSNRSMKTAIEGQDNNKQERQVSISSGESLDDVRQRSKGTSIVDDLATVARVGGKAVYYAGKALGKTIKTGYDIYNWLNEGEQDASAEASRGIRDDDEEVQPPIDEGVFNRTQRIQRRGASRSRSNTPENLRREEEQASGSNDAIRLLRRGASRSRSNTPPKKNKKI